VSFILSKMLEGVRIWPINVYVTRCLVNVAQIWIHTHAYRIRLLVYNEFILIWYFNGKLLARNRIDSVLTWVENVSCNRKIIFFFSAFLLSLISYSFLYFCVLTFKVSVMSKESHIRTTERLLGSSAQNNWKYFNI